MTILIFLVVLVILIVVHELGHLIVAKLSGMRVDEFGLGYPPRALTLGKIGETAITLNWLPFGGFVKIYGEDSEDAIAGKPDPRAFGQRPRILQALVLIAGIAMNLFLAWLLLSATLFMGTPRALTPEEITHAPDAAIVVASVLPGAPAATAGLQPGDTITSATFGESTFTGSDTQEFTNFVASDTTDTPIVFDIVRNNAHIRVSATPEEGVIDTDVTRHALGLGLATVGTVSVPLLEAPILGAQLTWEATKQTAVGLADFFFGLATFSADLSQVSGPVGIAGVVGSASAEGLAPLLSIMALISINLALINLLPIPALDGGRLLFVVIEAIIRKPIKPIVANIVNTTGFALLILLMLFVTASDIFKIFS